MYYHSSFNVFEYFNLGVCRANGNAAFFFLGVELTHGNDSLVVLLTINGDILNAAILSHIPQPHFAVMTRSHQFVGVFFVGQASHCLAVSSNLAHKSL